MTKKWIPKDLKKGALHRTLEIPEKKKIPIATLIAIRNRLSAKAKGDKKLSASDLKLLQRINFALRARKFR